MVIAARATAAPRRAVQPPHVWAELNHAAALPEPVDMDAAVRSAAGSLRAVVAAVDAGEFAADEVQRAYLSGGVDALESVAGVPTAQCPYVERSFRRFA